MKKRWKYIALTCMAAALYASATIAAADNDGADHELVRDGDVVREWRNPKLTEITELTELAAATKVAQDEPILIFKHSTTCPISGRAAQRMDAMLTESEEQLPRFFMVKVIESRPVSNTIEAAYEVKHESPQILLIKNGESVWDADHDEITAEAVLKAIEENDAQPKEESRDKSKE